jgi:hypothetical protein
VDAELFAFKELDLDPKYASATEIRYLPFESLRI